MPKKLDFFQYLINIDRQSRIVFSDLKWSFDLSSEIFAWFDPNQGHVFDSFFICVVFIQIFYW